MSFLRHVVRCTDADLTGFLAFEVAGQRVGWVRPAIAERLQTLAHFQLRADRLVLDPALDGFAARSAALAEAVALLGDAAERKISGEMFPLLPRWGVEPLAKVDRAAAVPLGFTAYGVHVNGYVRDGDKIRLWVGKRADNRPIEPGKLDHLVAGGLPSGLTLAENLVKEAEEEAGLSAEIARRARPAGTVSYLLKKGAGLRNDTLFVYDLELPPDLVPHNRDGEVEQFELWDLDRVQRAVRETDDFKFNVALVVTDFLIRHGAIDPDREPDYQLLVAGLRGIRPG